LRFTVRHRAIFFVIVSIVAAILAVASFDALISVYIRDVIHKGEQLFGALVSIVGVGTIIGAMLISRTAKTRPKVNLVIAGILIMGVSVFIMAAFPLTAAVLASSVVLGVGVAYVLIPSQTLIQEETPHEMLGRVSSTSLSLMTISQLFAFLMAGAIAERIGIINLYYVVAAMLTVTAVFGYVYARVNRVGESKARPAPLGAEAPPVE
jgi:MFS transporter, DHA3 family, macrolide efflux protein